MPKISFFHNFAVDFLLYTQCKESNIYFCSWELFIRYFVISLYFWITYSTGRGILSSSENYSRTLKCGLDIWDFQE